MSSHRLLPRQGHYLVLPSFRLVERLREARGEFGGKTLGARDLRPSDLESGYQNHRIKIKKIK
jgi:hypothetical protein